MRFETESDCDIRFARHAIGVRNVEKDGEHRRERGLVPQVKRLSTEQHLHRKPAKNIGRTRRRYRSVAVLAPAKDVAGAAARARVIAPGGDGDGIDEVLRAAVAVGCILAA